MQTERHQGGFWARMGIAGFLVALAAGGGFLAVSSSGDLRAQAPDPQAAADDAAAADPAAASQASPDAPEEWADAAAAPDDPAESDAPAADLEQRLARLEQELAALRAPISENTVNIEDLKLKTDELTDVVKRDIEQRLDAISEPDPSRSGYYVPSVYGNMDKSAYFAEQMGKAVHATMKDRTCTLRIINRTAGQQMLRINDEGSWIVLDAGQELQQQFPVGAVITRLPGQDPVSWFLGPPNYRQDVQIVLR